MKDKKEFERWIESLPCKYSDLLFVGPTKIKPFTVVIFKTIPIAIINHNTQKFSTHGDLYANAYYEFICHSIEAFIDFSMSKNISSKATSNLLDKLFYFNIHRYNYKIKPSSIELLIQELILKLDVSKVIIS